MEGSGGTREGRPPEETLGGQSMQLQSAGVTLLGVILSIGATVGFGVKAEWWIRVPVAVATVVGLVLVFHLAAQPGRGPVARLAGWITRGF